MRQIAGVLPSRAAYAEGELLLEVGRKAEKELRSANALKPEESAVLALLQQRLARTLEGQLGKSLVALKAGRKKASPRSRSAAARTAA